MDDTTKLALLADWLRARFQPVNKCLGLADTSHNRERARIHNNAGDDVRRKLAELEL